MDAEFENLIRRVRGGDADAAHALVSQFESAVRVAVRARLCEPELRRRFDSLDICQSVLASFFFRIVAGQFDLERPPQLVALLTKMVRNKLAWHVRYHRQERRDIRRTRHDAAAILSISSTQCDPSRQLQAKELLERTWKTMDAEMRDIAFRRLEGQSWAEVAEGIGGTAGARRKQFARGLDEIAQRLGIDDAG